MSAKYFIDTNIFVYSFDKASPAKQKISQDLIASTLANNQGIISYQVVQEFINFAAGKFAQPFSMKELLNYFEEVLEPLCEVHSSSKIYQKAVELKHDHRFSFYDALIIAGALQGGCKIIYSEDFQHGQKLAGLEILNPFLD